MFRRFSIVFAIFFAMTSATAAETSIARLNQLISLMRLHTGTMEGPVKHSIIDEEGYKTKMEFGVDTKKKKQFLRLQVAEKVDSREKIRGKMVKTRSFYVATYEDYGPDGILDHLSPRPVKKKDSGFIQEILSDDEDNQDEYDKLILRVIKFLQSAPAL